MQLEQLKTICRFQWRIKHHMIQSPFKYQWLMMHSFICGTWGMVFQVSKIRGSLPILSQELHKWRNVSAPSYVILTPEMNGQGPAQFISSSVLCCNIQGIQLCGWVSERCVPIQVTEIWHLGVWFWVYVPWKVSYRVLWSLCSMELGKRAYVNDTCYKIDLYFFVEVAAGISGWATDRSFTRHCNFVSEEYPGAF